MLSSRTISSSRPQQSNSNTNPFAPQSSSFQSPQQQQQNTNRSQPTTPFSPPVTNRSNNVPPSPQQNRSGLRRDSHQQQQYSNRPSNTEQQQPIIDPNLELGCIIGFSNVYRECVVAIPGNSNLYLKSYGGFMVLEDIENRQNQILLRDHDMQISSIDVSASGRLFVSGQEGSNSRQGQVAPVFLWSLSSFASSSSSSALQVRRVAVLTGLTLRVNVLKISPDDRFVCGCGDDAQLIIWEISTGDIVFCERITQKPLSLIIWINNNEIAYASENHLFSFKLRYDNYSCQYAIQKEPYSLPPSNQLIRSYTAIDVSADRMYLYFGTSAGEIIVLKTDTRIFRCAIAVCSHGVGCLKVLPSGELLCGGGDGSINLLLGQDKSWQLQSLTMLEGRLLSLSQLLSSSGNGSESSRGPNTSSFAVEFIASTVVGHVYRCAVQMNTAKCMHSLLSMSHTSPITCLATHSGANTNNNSNNNIPTRQSSSSLPMVLSGTVTGELRLWNTNTFSILQYTRRAKSGAVLCLFVLSNYGIFTGWQDGSIVCYKINDLSNQMWFIANGHRDGTSSVDACVSNSNNNNNNNNNGYTRFLVTGGCDGSVRVWKLDTREMVSQYNAHALKPVLKVLIDINASHIIHSLGGDGSVASYDIKASRFVMNHVSNEGTAAYAMIQRLDHEYELISADSRGKLLAWDIDVREPVLCVEDPAKCKIRTCALSPSGRWLAFAGDERRVKILDLMTYEVVSVGDAHSDSISSLVWSHDERQIVSGGDDCCLSMWNFIIE